MQRATPTFNMLDWRATSQTPTRLVYRPGLKVLFYRGLLATFMIALAVFGYYGGVMTLNPGVSNTRVREALERMKQETAALIPEGVTLEEWERAQEQSRQRVEQIQQRRRMVVARVLIAVQVALVLFIALMLLLPASILWNHVVLLITPRRELEIRRWMLLPRRVSVALADLKRVQYGAQEIIHRTTTGQITGHYWRWSVQLQCGDTFSGRTAAILYPCRQTNRPGTSRMPPEVATIIKWLCAHAQLQVSGPFFKDAAYARGKRAHVGEVSYAPVGALRESKDARRAPGQSKPDQYTEHVSHHIEVVDQNGARRQYDSLDALPDHIRRRVPPQGKSFPQGTVSQRIIIRNADGTETRYNSLDELPPDLRARFEAARNKSPRR